MASVTVTYIWDSGDSVNIHMDSDLESTTELREQAAAMWRDTWASLEPADDGWATAPDA
jgi:hypothetical protein